MEVLLCVSGVVLCVILNYFIFNNWGMVWEYYC